ncbi:MAG: hypothetical protein UR27_C0011G0034 [Candidatus Peregrinibacteria bacterium GW2011_GWA2_33_10]|nr:MAG: hypothetical protein UR27_C0011G0034 [Candidatus Peregrinibacteria bacterium GW2011_GWA2_33_10]KKP38895.1 MAG: hypothetical protein UR30_C0014G0033 [Candidatus Peregrinibacteria bacterium GW2011_GWC2_33_13]
MTNAASSKKHGLVGIKSRQKKSPMHKRRNKEKARIRREERRKDSPLFN